MGSEIGMLGSWLLVGLLVGLLYAPIALGLSLSFRTLNYPDMGCEGAFVFSGAAAIAVLNGTGSVFLSVAAAIFCGAVAGVATATFHLVFGVSKLLSGIITWGILYSLAIRVMSGLSNLPATHPTLFQVVGSNGSIILECLCALVILIVMFFGLVAVSKSRFGRTSRALGDQPWFVVSMGMSPAVVQIGGLAFANAVLGAGAALVVHYRQVSDINMATGVLVSGLAAMILGEAVFRARSVAAHLLSVIVGSVVYNLAISAFYYDWSFNPSRIFLPSDVRMVSGLLLLLSATAVSRLKNRYRLYASEW